MAWRLGGKRTSRPPDGDLQAEADDEPLSGSQEIAGQVGDGVGAGEEIAEGFQVGGRVVQDGSRHGVPCREPMPVHTGIYRVDSCMPPSPNQTRSECSRRAALRGLAHRPKPRPFAPTVVAVPPGSASP